MSGVEGLTGFGWPAGRRPVPMFLYAETRFGSFYVAEADSNRPPYFSSLLRILMRKGRSREDAEDLIQEAMLRLHVYAEGDIQNKEAFLRCAVRNLAIDQYRHDRSRLCREVPIDEVDRQSPLIVHSPTPDRILDDQQRLDGIMARLDAVNRRTREIYLAHRSGYTYGEIADHMGITTTTVKRHIARAQSALMKIQDWILDDSAISRGAGLTSPKCRSTI